MPTFNEVFSKLAGSSRGEFHALDEYTYTFLGDVLLQVVVDEEPAGSFDEPWVRKFPDKSAEKFNVHVMYGGVRIHTFTFILVDGARHWVPLPTDPDLQIDDLQYTIAKVIQESGELDDALQRAGIKVVRLHNKSLMY